MHKPSFCDVTTIMTTPQKSNLQDFPYQILKDNGICDDMKWCLFETEKNAERFVWWLDLVLGWRWVDRKYGFYSRTIIMSIESPVHNCNSLQGATVMTAVNVRSGW